MASPSIKTYAANSQELDFIEKVSQHYENVYSVPRIAGRILGLLLLVPRPVSMEEAARTLEVSHGSVSTNLHLLMVLGYVEKLHFTGQRAAYYRFLPHSRVKILHERVNHYQALKKQIETDRQKLVLPDDAVRRLDEMVAWSDLAIKKFSEFIVEWEEIAQNPDRR